MPEVVVSSRGRDRIRSGHPWVYRSDVKKVRDADSGDLVEISCRGRFLGWAFYSSTSQIAIRMVTTGRETVDDDFWRARLETALSSRRRLTPPGTNAYRWVHGESDGIPSLVVDRYGDVLSVQTLSQGAEKLKETLARLMVELVQPVGILERNDPKVRTLEGLPQAKGILWGDVPPSVRVEEAGVRFDVDLWTGQKTGLFLDQRENHLAAAGYASGKALDVFAYDGGFSLHLAGRCGKVVAVDNSAEALSRLRLNAETNGRYNIETIEANAFDVLHDLSAQGESFDTVVLDPPAFAKNRSAVPQAVRGYKEINLRALKILKPGGFLVSSSCSYHIHESNFLDIVSSAAADTGSRLVLLEKRTQSRDHPILLNMPETYYLKCLLLQKR